ncbi:MAG: hypothetical protein ACI9HA_003443 [Dinoroseobacter sp.]|jgi:hypothetical protein
MLTMLLPFQVRIQAMDKDMQERIAEIISEYTRQGVHRTGTDIDHLSADWLAQRIKALGVHPSESSFPFKRLQSLQTSLSLSGLDLSGVPLYDCSYTGDKGITGSMGDVGSDADIGVAMSLPFDSSESGRIIHVARREGKHKAIVVVTDDRLPADGVATLNAENYADPFGPPVLQVANKHWPEIQAAMKSSATGQIIVQCDYVDATARNIEARIKGRNPQLAPIVIMTPRSGWWTCASERGGGIACLLEMMRGIKASEPLRDVIFTANTGHELGHTGSDYFLHNNPQLIKGAHIWVHLGANFAAKYGAQVRLQYSDEQAVQSLAPLLLLNSINPDAQTEMNQRPLGEARNIYDGGGRYVSILGGNGLFHHPADVWPDAVNLDATTKWVSTFVQLGVKLAASV